MRILLCLLTLAFAAVSPRVWALQPDKPFHHHVRHSWSLEEGLPQITVTSLAQDRDGYLWAGTQSGLARFDGVRFTNFTPISEPALAGIWVRALWVARDGRLWIGTYRGLAVHDRGRFTQVPSADPERWPTLDISAIAEDADGRIWVSTNAGLFQARDGGLHPVEDAPPPVHGLLVDGDALWVGGRGAVHVLRQGRWRTLPLPAEAATVGVTRLRRAQGRLWAGTSHGLYVRGDGAWVTYEDIPALRRSPIELLYEDSDGNMWVGGDVGLARLRDGRLAEFIAAQDAGGIAGVRTALEDREGNLWFGSQWESLIRVSDSLTHRYSTPEGLHEPIVWSVAPDPDGRRIWVGTNDGVSLFEDGRFRLIARSAALPHPHAYNLYAERERLWIGTRRGIAVLDHAGPFAGRVRSLPELRPLADMQIHGFTRAPGGALWINASGGVFRLDAEGLRHYDRDDGLRDPRATYLVRTPEGRIVVGGQGGLAELRGERFETVGEDRGLPASDVTAIHVLPDGRLVVGTFFETMYFEHGGRWHVLDTARGMPTNAPFHITHHAGYLWVGGIRGITRVPIADLAALAEGRIAKVRGDMMLDERGDSRSGKQGCCNGAGNAKGFLRDGTLWFPTRDGIVAMQARDFVRNGVAPTAVIERMQVREEWRPASAWTGAALPSNARDLSFEFTVLSLQDPQSVTVEYRLHGYDEKWRSAVPTNRNTRYTNLPPGHYAFEVRGRNNAGIPTPQTARLPFSIRPYFYETAAFYGVLAALALAAVYGGYRYQQRRHRLQKAELEAVVQQRTQALEAARQRLEDASRTDPLTGLRNRRYVADQIPADLSYYDRQLRQGLRGSEVMLLALVDIDHFKSINDRYGHKAGDLVLQQFARILAAQVRSGDYVARWGGEEFLLVFRPMPREHIAVLGQRISEAVAGHVFDIGDGRTVRVTCSVGMAEHPLFQNDSLQLGWEAMVELADVALYYVKTHGRDGWAALRPTDRTRMETLVDDVQRNAAELLRSGQLTVIGRIAGESVGPDLTPAGAQPG